MGKITKKEVKQRKILFSKIDSDNFLKYNWCPEREGEEAVYQARLKVEADRRIKRRKRRIKKTTEAKETLRKEGIKAPCMEGETYSIEVIEAFLWLKEDKEKKNDPMEIVDFFSIEETPANHSRGLFHQAGNIVQ